jgi:hypothetical protein
MESLAVVQAEAFAATGGEKPAEEQYDSDYFNMKLELARYDHDEVYLVTPENGLIKPNVVVPPDTYTFFDCEPGEQARWALDVVGELVAEVRRNSYDPIAVYADLEMRNAMKENASAKSRFAAAGARLMEPLAGLGDRDRQSKWLSEQLYIRRHADADGQKEITYDGEASKP